MKNWILKEKPAKEYRLRFANYSAFIQTLLFQRGIKAKKEAETFFDLEYDKGTTDPFLLSGMKKAVTRIVKALKEKEKIAIYGDYDADGVTAATILNQLFLELTVKPVVYIPDRVKEGYGISNEAIDYLKKKQVKLVITVDSGIRNYEEIKRLVEQKIDVIVTDHHALPPKLPPALAVINPQQDNKKSFCSNFSGAGVAFKLAQAVVKKLGHDRFSVGFEKWLLDLVAIGTISDMVPLIKENRLLAKYGLIVLGKTRRLGVKCLMDNAGISYTREPIRSEHVGFQIGPRINAAGRMDHANSAFVLLNSTQSVEAEKLALKLESQNRKRQNETRRIFKEVEAKELSRGKIIIEGSKNWPLGIVGLVAGRLCDKWSRPTLIYSDEGDCVRGSARSIPEFDLVKALENLKHILLEYGGHKQAAGFTLLKKDLKEFKEKMEVMAEKQVKEKDMIPKLLIDYRIEFDEINDSVMQEIKSLEPFGMDNPQPVFMVKGAKVKSVRMVGNGQKHLKLTVCENKECSNFRLFEAIGFNFEEHNGKIKKDDLIDIAFNLHYNNFNGRESLEFRMIDIKLSE